MLEIGIFALGAALGVGAAWMVLRGQIRSAVLAESQALQSRLVAAETLGDELRKQLSKQDLDLGDLRGALETERTLRAQAETRAAATRENLEEQKRLLESAREKLTETFKALSADALRSSRADFLAEAGHVMGPLQASLDRYETELKALETSRQHAYGSLEQHLSTLNAASEQLQREAAGLATALSKSSQARGRWGEIALRRIVELAGMTARADFNEQVSAEGEDGRVRPDVIVHLPDRREIVIDAKAPLSAYFEALEAARPEDRQAALARHAQQLRQHMTQLASKTYWAEFPQACDFVVMFIPGESFFAAAIEADGALIEDAMTRRIVIATPTTLIGLLLAIHHGWRQAQMAESAQKISELGKDLYDRVRTLGRHFEKMRKGLVQATEAYNDTVGSLERRVLPAARRLEELGAASGDEISVLEPIDQQPRAVTAAELMTQEKLPEVEP